MRGRQPPLKPVIKDSVRTRTYERPPTHVDGTVPARHTRTRQGAGLPRHTSERGCKQPRRERAADESKSLPADAARGWHSAHKDSQTIPRRKRGRFGWRR